MALDSKTVYKENSVKVKQEIVTDVSEQVRFDQELGNESSPLCLNRVSMDNIRQQSKQDIAELYAGHVVKVEIVIGPEMLQQPDEAATSKGTDTVAGPLLETTKRSKSSSEISVDDSHGHLNRISPYTYQKRLNPTALDDDDLNCTICQRKLSSKRNLRLHLLKHKESPFNCDICGAKRKSLVTLEAHIVRMHTNKCTVCTKQFRNKRLLQAHIRRHYDEKPFSCSICEKKFGVIDDLRRHLHTHTEETRYPCNICRKMFRTKQNLQLHSMRAHTTYRPYNCSVCNKSFLRHYEYNRHIKVHTGEKPFCCSLCPRKFVHGASLKDHIAKRHTKEYTCN